MQTIDFGAGGRNRTGTGLLDPRDFKSLASTNSATPAHRRHGHIIWLSVILKHGHPNPKRRDCSIEVERIQAGNK
jgi:hypothetical protein